MHLFLTGVLPFLAHDHASAAAFLTCRHHNFHASIIPEFLSDDMRVKKLTDARQLNQLEADTEKQSANLYSLFVQTPLMQFSPSLVLWQKDCNESILKPLLETKYFTRTLQRCCVVYGVPLTNDLLRGLSKVQSLTNLDLGRSKVKTEHLEIIIDSFPSLETLTIQNAEHLKISTLSESANRNLSPTQPATKTLRSLKLGDVDPLFAAQFILHHFPSLRKLVLSAKKSKEGLDLRPLSSSLPHLTDLDLENFTLENTESLKNLVLLSRLRFGWCHVPDLSFLTQENSLPELTTLHIDDSADGLSASSFASLSHAPNLHVLNIVRSKFDNHCLKYLENMTHLRKLKLSRSELTGDSRSLTTLMQMLFQLEELNLSGCRIGDQGAIAGALFNTHSLLRVLNLRCCRLVNDDLNGIGALKNTLEVLDLSDNDKLTAEALEHCKDLMQLKSLNLSFNGEIADDLSPLRGCLNLEELDISCCDRVTDDSFEIFSEEPNSFPNLRILNMAGCEKLTEKVFGHLSKNNHLIYQLKKLSVYRRLLSSATARNNICQLKSLRLLIGVFSDDADDADDASDEEIEFVTELMRRLKNLEEISQ